jgi:hypothetical protein
VWRPVRCLVTPPQPRRQRGAGRHSAGARGRDRTANCAGGVRCPTPAPGTVGLFWAINGGRLVELHRDWAVFELAENGPRRIFERRRVDAANVRLPWIGA